MLTCRLTESQMEHYFRKLTWNAPLDNQLGLKIDENMQ